jgi:hypothetical protein
MLVVLRMLLGLVLAVGIGVPLSLFCWPFGLFQRHVLLTLLMLMPTSPFRGMFAIWIAHTIDGHCWRCGAHPPTWNDLRGKGLP